MSPSQPARLEQCVGAAQRRGQRHRARAAKAFSDGKVDLAVVAETWATFRRPGVVVMSHVVALVIAPPGSTIDSMDKLKGRRVGVLGGDANTKIVDVLSKEYGFDREKVFRDIACPMPPCDSIQGDERAARRDSHAGKYLSMVRDIFQQGPKALPTLVEIESAGAIAEAERAYESFDVPKARCGQLRPFRTTT